jgi:hypothetical protein
LNHLTKVLIESLPLTRLLLESRHQMVIRLLEYLIMTNYSYRLRFLSLLLFLRQFYCCLQAELLVLLIFYCHLRYHFGWILRCILNCLLSRVIFFDFSVLNTVHGCFYWYVTQVYQFITAIFWFFQIKLFFSTAHL